MIHNLFVDILSFDSGKHSVNLSICLLFVLYGNYDGMSRLFPMPIRKNFKNFWTFYRETYAISRQFHRYTALEQTAACTGGGEFHIISIKMRYHSNATLADEAAIEFLGVKRFNRPVTKQFSKSACGGGLACLSEYAS